MKRGKAPGIFLFVCLAVFAVSAAGQERETLGAGLEVSMISLKDASGGFVFYYGFNLFPRFTRFTLGVKFGGSSDFRSMNALEGSLFARWRALTLGSADSAPEHRPLFFVQAGLGAGFYTLFGETPHEEGSRSRLLPLFEAALGLRLYPGRTFFVEPSLRYAYPSGPGLGVCIGI
jgi:hypothetical protein